MRPSDALSATNEGDWFLDSEWTTLHCWAKVMALKQIDGIDQEFVMWWCIVFGRSFHLAVRPSVSDNNLEKNVGYLYF